MELTDNEVEFIEVAFEEQKAEIESLKSENNELKRLLEMQSDLDLQGYEHMRDELQELRAKLAKSEKRVKALENMLRICADNAHDSGEEDSLEDEINELLEATCQK